MTWFLVRYNEFGFEVGLVGLVQYSPIAGCLGLHFTRYLRKYSVCSLKCAVRGATGAEQGTATEHTCHTVNYLPYA